MSKEIKKYDNRGNLIYIKYSDGDEYWYEYDENSRLIYSKSSNGNECRYKYDENNNLIYYKNSDGYERWLKYNKNNRRIEITKQEYKEIEFRKKEKEYLGREKCSRFELMEI